MVMVEKDICCSGTLEPDGPIVAANILVTLVRRISESGGDVARRLRGFGLILLETVGSAV